MAFKMKGINGIINNTSPLLNTDPGDKKIVNTDFVTDLAGEDFATARTITTDPTRKVETQATSDEAYLNSFKPEYNRAKEEGYGGSMTDYIDQKNETLGFKGSEIDQTRDYNVEKTPEYQIDKNTGASYKRIPIEGSKIVKREYYYPTYNTGHHERGTLVTTNEMLGNFREKYGESQLTNKLYEKWFLQNTGKPVQWKKGSTYSRNPKSGGGSESENKGNWQNVNE